MPDIAIDQITVTKFRPPVNRITLHQGDSADLTFSLNVAIDLWDVRVELWDNHADAPPSGEIHTRSYQSAGVSGGAITEVSVDTSAMEFTVHVTGGDTADFRGDVQLEIEINTNESGNNQVKTIYRDFIDFIPTRIS